MNGPSVSIVVATCGDRRWEDMAYAHAVPSTEGQGADEVLIAHYPDMGVAAARNALAAQATGDMLIHLDADDALCDGYVDAIRAAWWDDQDNGPFWGEPIFVPAMGLVEPDGICLTVPSIPDWDRWPQVNCACIGTAVPRTLFVEVGGFSDEWPIYEDFALFVAMAIRGARLVSVPDAVYCATRNPDGRNLQPAAVRTATYDAICARYDLSVIPRNKPL